MNKRTAIDGAGVQVLTNTKHAKVDSGNLADFLDDIQFMDFDEEFVSSEEPIDELQPQQQQEQHASTSDNIETCDEIDAQQNFVDLSTWKRCVVERYEQDARTRDLIIYGREDPTTANQMQKFNADDGTATTTKPMQCRLQHFWSQCRIDAGDIVSIVAIWNAQLQTYCVTNNDGFVVVRPDFLVSGTTVVGGLFCMRKAVLQDRFKGIETGIKIVSKVPFENEVKS